MLAQMGLGKTAQCIAFLDILMKTGGFDGPFLIVVPLSVIGHWKREIEKWSRMVSSQVLTLKTTRHFSMQIV